MQNSKKQLILGAKYDKNKYGGSKRKVYNRPVK